MKMNIYPVKKQNLGFWETLIPAAAKALTGDGGGGSKTNVTTQVSPQISPIFQQQFQPQNSGLTAGTSMIGAGTGERADSPVISGSLPDQLSPIYTSGAQTNTTLKSALPWILGALGIGVAIKLYRDSRK